ncbi:MAG: Na+/H+ antiporter subunit E [Spirochaetota bacterium]|nr:Na+/H+ antiporter subunit E [Spirochaetota bacterium]
MAFTVTFIILLIFWILVSGLFDYWHFTLGIISCALVAYMSSSVLFKNNKVRGKSFTEVLRLLTYLPWLLYQIILANLQIAYLALHPRMRELIDPHIIKFRTKLKKDLSLVLFANSITLTPGTITVLIEDDQYYVHAINKSIAADLPGKMEEKVAQVFLED